MEVVIAIFLCGLGVVLLVGGQRVYRHLMAQAAQASQTRPEPQIEDIEVSGDVTPAGLVYLFGEGFVREKSGGAASLARDRAFAPLTDTELDAEDWAVQILHASLCALYAAGCIDCRMAERAATFMPPFPQKHWEMEITQLTPFPSSPVADALDVALDLMRKRQQQRVAQGKEEPGDLWCPLDEVIEKALKAMRQEMSFWERGGVYADLRNYVASALVVQGYLIQPERETWLDRTRSRKPKPNVSAIEELRPAAEELNQQLRRFRIEHGSAHARGEGEPDASYRGPQHTDPALTTQEQDLENMPLDDCLRISIHEALVSLKQLEPSGEGGI